MQIHDQYPGNLPPFNKAVITIGTFDGVHTGHRQIIDQLIREAKKIGGETVIISFYPHPRTVIRKSAADIQLLNTPEEKIALLEAAGIDHLVIVPFNEAFANQTPEAYITDFLVKHFHPHTVIIGYDHRFGKNRSGDFSLLESFGKKWGFAVMEIPKHLLDEVAISSTKIRQAIQQTEMETANRYLGYAYSFEGLIIKGNQLGRTIGYPTANLQVQHTDKLIPGNGVYAVTAEIIEHGKMVPGMLKGMMNIGIRPTINGKTLVTEVHLFDFDQDIYGCTLRVKVLHWLRGESKFDGLDGLKAQLAKDKDMAIRALATASS